MLALSVLTVALLVSVVTDLRRRLILNVVTLPALGLILTLYAVNGGLPELTNSLLGVAVCGVPFLLAALPGWMGMGDVKLMAVVGAALGWPLSLRALLGVSLAGGVQAIAWLLVARLRGKERPRYVPYAIAIAAGTAGAFLLGGPLL
jgi:prepilin peptidase CpaA